MSTRASRSPAPDPAAVADAIHSAAIHLLRHVRVEDERSGVSPARLSALSVLVFAGPMRLTDLARAEQVTPPTMTNIVNALVELGLVRRKVERDDARAVRLGATARGKHVMFEGRRRRVERLAAALEVLSASDLEVLARAAQLTERVARSI